MRPINTWLLTHNIRIAQNPCVSPDFCLDWPALSQLIQAGKTNTWAQSTFAIKDAQVAITEDPKTGDCAWIITGKNPGRLQDAIILAPDRQAFPATWENLVTIKNLVLEHNPASTIFPRACPALAKTSIGVGARFTTLHWPAVEWVMSKLSLPLTANQNSIPRELVFDVDAMLAGKLDTVPFPFIGADVPEGHQGQSVEGMSHGAVLSKLRTGFHLRAIPWGFNADHQPVGGKYDKREAQLAKGCVLSSYITFDLSPELGCTPVPKDPAAAFAALPAQVMSTVQARMNSCGQSMSAEDFRALMLAVWPAMQKMLRRDQVYKAERERLFTTPEGRDYLRELSIDELPGLTKPSTLAAMLALSEALGMKVHFVAPAFGFQKNFPFDDNAELERRIDAAWKVCEFFGVSIGFHSGSGKSAENYTLAGKMTKGHFEIKTSGRYTYEMGRALAVSTDPADQALWRDWWIFTRDLAVQSAHSADTTEQGMARRFIEHALKLEGKPTEVFQNPAASTTALAGLKPSPEHMFWFEYNFLFVLAAAGKADKKALGDHSPVGYAQRARFYAISDQGRLLYKKRVAEYLLFLAETTGIASPQAIAKVRKEFEAITSEAAFLSGI